MAINKDKVNSLTKYAAGLRDKLAAKEVPVKHKDNPESYKNFLRNELKAVERTLNDAKEAALVTK